MNWGAVIPLLAAAMIFAALGRVLFDLWRGWRREEQQREDEA